MVPSSSGSGDKVAIEAYVNELAVPEGYISGSALADSSTYNNATFASLGLTPGTYVESRSDGRYLRHQCRCNGRSGTRHFAFVCIGAARPRLFAVEEPAPR